MAGCGKSWIWNLWLASLLDYYWRLHLVSWWPWSMTFFVHWYRQLVNPSDCRYFTSCSCYYSSQDSSYWRKAGSDHALQHLAYWCPSTQNPFSKTFFIFSGHSCSTSAWPLSFSLLLGSWPFGPLLRPIPQRIRGGCIRSSKSSGLLSPGQTYFVWLAFAHYWGKSIPFWCGSVLATFPGSLVTLAASLPSSWPSWRVRGRPIALYMRCCFSDHFVNAMKSIEHHCAPEGKAAILDHLIDLA